MIYCDTSLLISALTTEAMSEAVEDWLADQAIGSLAISWWVDVEVASALAAKRRAKLLSEHQRQNASRAWNQIRVNLATVDVVQRHFAMAIELVGRADGLRASDALHLAVAQERGWQLATLDRGLNKAAVSIGVEVSKIEN